MLSLYRVLLRAPRIVARESLLFPRDFSHRAESTRITPSTRPSPRLRVDVSRFYYGETPYKRMPSTTRDSLYTSSPFPWSITPSHSFSGNVRVLTFPFPPHRFSPRALVAIFPRHGGDVSWYINVSVLFLSLCFSLSLFLSLFFFTCLPLDHVLNPHTHPLFPDLVILIQSPHHDLRSPAEVVDRHREEGLRSHRVLSCSRESFISNAA